MQSESSVEVARLYCQTAVPTLKPRIRMDVRPCILHGQRTTWRFFDCCYFERPKLIPRIPEAKQHCTVHRTVVSSGWACLFIVEAKADNVVKNNDGQSLLHSACINGHLKTAQLLMQHGDQLEAMDCQLNTPLHLASRRGRFEMVQLLLDSGTASRQWGQH